MVEGGRFEIYFGCKLNAGSNPALSASDSRGEVTEWLKVHGWNPCVGQLTGGSNPPLSSIFFAIGSEGRVLGTGTCEPRQVREEATVVGAFRALGVPGSHQGGCKHPTAPSDQQEAASLAEAARR